MEEIIRQQAEEIERLKSELRRIMQMDSVS